MNGFENFEMDRSMSAWSSLDEIKGEVSLGYRDTGLVLERKQYITKETRKSYWIYAVTGIMRGRQYAATMVVTKKDPALYGHLDTIYRDSGLKAVPIFMEEYSFNQNGKDIKGVRYFVELEDEVMPLRVQIKPRELSDKTVFDYFIAWQKKFGVLKDAETQENVVPPERPETNKKGGKSPE